MHVTRAASLGRSCRAAALLGGGAGVLHVGVGALALVVAAVAALLRQQCKQAAGQRQQRCGEASATGSGAGGGGC